MFIIPKYCHIAKKKISKYTQQQKQTHTKKTTTSDMFCGSDFMYYTTREAKTIPNA